MTATLLATLDRLLERRGERWLFGPACLPGEHHGYATGWASWRRWLTEVEQVFPQPVDTVSRLRLMAVPAATRWPSHALLRTSPRGLAAAPLTTEDISRHALDGLCRTGLVDIEPDAQMRTTQVDLARVVLALDAELSGTTPIGDALGARVMFGWPGLLAEVWQGYDERRRAAKLAATAAGEAWSEPPDQLTRPQQWLDEAIIERCPVPRLFGMMDGVALVASWTPANTLRGRLAQYYEPGLIGPIARDALHYSNRSRLFVVNAEPGFAYTSQGDGSITLGEQGPEGTRAYIKQHIRDTAGWLCYLTESAPTMPYRAWWEVQERLDSAWGSAMLARLAERFHTFLTTVLSLDGSARGAWLDAPAALAAYGGFALCHGDSDAARRFGGVVRAGATVPAEPVATLQAHLNDLGFAVRDARGEFAAHTSAAVRELQLEAFATEVTVRRGGVSRRRAAHRRYFGAASGVVDEETARTIDVWRRPSTYGNSDVDRIVRTSLAGVTVQEMLERSEEHIFSWPALAEGKVQARLSDAQWRLVGDRQKALIRRRLSRRSRYADDPAGRVAFDSMAEAAFVFNTDDLTNVFQLEAVAEFYVNYDDPWLPLSATRVRGANMPLAPSGADDTPARGYRRVDLLDPWGSAATPVAPVPPPAPGAPAPPQLRFRLDGTDDLKRVWARDPETVASSHRDLIYLADATLVVTTPGGTAPYTRTWYKIMAIDVATRTVTVDADPKLATASTAWRIRLRPRLVLVDPMGSRPPLAGADAAVAGTGPVEGRKLRLPAGADLSTININYDTVYLDADTARVSKTYRIVGCDAAARTLTLDGAPELDGHRTAWAAPAGLGGRFTHEPNAFKPRSTGMDNYEGVLFLVYDGRVHTAMSWTSMTSVRHPVGDMNRSSIRGNTEYECRSWVSGDDWKAYSFTVITSGMPNHVDVARNYFDGVANPPGTWAAPPETTYVTRDPDGKESIRIHDGHSNIGEDDVVNGTGSAGCVVSPNVHPWREVMISLHQLERALLGLVPSPDNHLNTIATCNSRDLAQDLWNNSHETPASSPNVPDAGWTGKLAAKLWLVRPDERPVAP